VIFGITIQINSSSVDVILRKFVDNVVHCIDLFIDIIPFPISNKCFWNIRRMHNLIFNINLFTCHNRINDLRYLLSSSVDIKCGKTRRVFRNSPVIKMSAPSKNWPFPFKYFSVRSSVSNNFLWAIVYLSYMISLHVWRSLSIPKLLIILHVGVSMVCKFNVNFSAECAIWPLSKSVVTIPDDANVN